MTPLAAFGLLLIAAALAGFPLARAIRRRDTTITDLLRVNAQAAGDLLEYAGDVAEAEIAQRVAIGAVKRWAARATRAEIRADDLASRLAFEQGLRAAAQIEADMYSTAFRGELTRQVNAELLRPEETAAEAVVFEFPTRGAK